MVILHLLLAEFGAAEDLRSWLTFHSLTKWYLIYNLHNQRAPSITICPPGDQSSPSGRVWNYWGRTIVTVWETFGTQHYWEGATGHSIFFLLANAAPSCVGLPPGSRVWYHGEWLGDVWQCSLLTIHCMIDQTNSLLKKALWKLWTTLYF